jgi:C4-dicarboxylate transporter DctM subunit
VIVVLLAAIVLFFVLGVPIAFALGAGASVAILWEGNLPISIVAQRMFFGLDSWLLMAIPLFMLAGQLMSTGGMSTRLVAFATELLGFVRGSLAMVSVAASMVFAGVSGSSTADTAAVGSILLPLMQERGYDMRFATALQAAAGSIGPIIPPSLLMILIGFTTGTSVSALFLGGIVPGLLIGFGLMVVAYAHAARGGDAYLPVRQGINLKRLLRTGIAAAPALGMPVIILVGIVGGFFTTTEAAVIAVVYGLLVSMFVYREITVAQLPRLIMRSAELAAVIMFIQTTAFLFAWLITVHEVPATLARLMVEWVSGPGTFFLLYLPLLLLVGAVMESFSATVVMLPIVFPIAQSFGVDPVHFGVVTTVGWAIGYVTPPFGATLFVACSLSGRSIRETTPYIVPIVVSMLVVLLLITYVPAIVLFIPGWFG